MSFKAPGRSVICSEHSNSHFEIGSHGKLSDVAYGVFKTTAVRNGEPFCRASITSAREGG